MIKLPNFVLKQAKNPDISIFLHNKATFFDFILIKNPYPGLAL